MPKYRFICNNCHIEIALFVASSTHEVSCKECSGTMLRQLPSNGSQTVTEVMDSFTGITRDQNHDEDNKARREQHYWDVEVPRFIETYSTQTCLEEGWLVYNDKDELVINKPPSKR